MLSKSLKLLVAVTTFLSFQAFATPPNTPTLDGRPIEYDDVDLVGTNPNLSNNFGPGNVITNLFVTWDETYVYFALQGQEVNDKLTIMIDVDPDAGTGATTTTNWSGPEEVYPNYIRYNDVGWIAGEDPAPAFGLDYQIASEGFFNNIMRLNYDGVDTPGTNNVESLFDSGNGATPNGSPVDMVVLAGNSSIDDLRGVEARIPWSVLYEGTRFGVVEVGEVIPRSAKLRVFAVLHNNDPLSSYSSDGIIPPQISAGSGLVDGKWTTVDYVDIDLDVDNDGLPDVSVGDVNPPYLKFVTGVQGKRQVFSWLNEAVDATTATDPLNWLVGTFVPESVTVVQSDAVLLILTNDLPANGNLIRVEATGVEDLSGNAKTTYLYFDPSATGLESSVTVRFLLNKNSGMGFSTANPRATTNLFINSGAAPLEFGYPPSKIAPLTMLNSTQYYRDVTFPPGTAEKIFYKYSGVLDGGALATGTNNYEAIRLVNYSDAARELLLPTNGITSLVVTDWLGAAAAPYRDPGTNTGHNALYTDVRRGDAGVRQRTTIKFQLDLGNRDLTGITRVMVMGSDPLRGFNLDNANFSDFPGPLVQWSEAGVELVDNGTLGDDVADDGIYSRVWAWTPTGQDAVVVPGFPNSLVGGDGSTSPYFGFGWVDGRSYRSFKYKFFVYRGVSQQNFEYPFSDIEYYIPSGVTNIVFEPIIWGNDGIPLPPPTNSPTMLGVIFTNNQSTVVFENTDLEHGLLISTNIPQGWLNFGHRAVTSSVPNEWRAMVSGVTDSESYAAFAGPAQPFRGVRVEPYPIPETGAIVRIFYNQHSRGLPGDRNVHIAGNWTTWNPVPMTFLGDGVWYYDLNATTSLFSNTEIKFKPRNLSGTQWEGMGGGGNDYFFYVGDLRASYTPNNPTTNDIFNIVYDANGGPLAAATNINAYVGFDEQWFIAGNRRMTNALGETNIWELAFPVWTSATFSINFVFNNGTIWDSEGTPPPNGRQWRVFLDQP